MNLEKRVEQLAFWVLGSLIVLIVGAGCDEPSPNGAPASSPPATTAPAASATPTAEPLTDPLQQSVTAVARLSSFRFRLTSEDVITGETLEREGEFVLGATEEVRFVDHWSGGSYHEIICIGARVKRCWGRVGEHPWVREFGQENNTFTFPQAYEQNVRRRTITQIDESADGTEIVVDWTGDSFPFAAHVDEVVENGRTWLQADTYLPGREWVELRAAGNGTLIQRTELIYEVHDVPVTIATPVAELVAPVATVPPISPTLATRLEEAPIPGSLFVPDADGQFTAVVVLHGSGGGLSYTAPIARQLAEAGYVALAYCYFGCLDSPDTLENIDLDAIIEAMDSLQNREDVKPDSLAVVGLSRGAELALILGVLNSDVGAVASVMGSPFVGGGIPSGGIAWRYQGEPLPFTSIPVEQINGPVLLMHGTVDRLWPVTYSYHLADRLQAHDRTYELMALPNREHNLGQPADVEQVIAFLKRTLP